MAVIRVEKRKGYTIMSNYHLRDKNLSLKAKGLLSIMLSLPDEWHYNVRGLAAICKEGVTSISSTLKELEQCGYMRRHQPNEGGKFGEIEYIISETPLRESGKGRKGQQSGQSDGNNSDRSENPSDVISGPSAASSPDSGIVPLSASQEGSGTASFSETTADEDACRAAFPSLPSPESPEPCPDSPHTGSPCTENPYTVFPYTGFPYAETSCTQNQNAYKIKNPGKTEKSITDTSNYPSINPEPDNGIPDRSAHQSAYGERMDMMDMDDRRLLQEIGAKKLQNDYDGYRKLVMENISYNTLLKRYTADKDTIRGIVDIMVDAICSNAPTIRIAGQDIPQTVVKSQFLKLKSNHIEYVMTCLERNTVKIRNIRNYLLTTLYNAPSTIDAYFQNWVQSDYPELAKR